MYPYGEWGLKVQTDMGSVQVRSESEKIDLYCWNYLTAVFSGSEHKLYLYKNGVKVAESRSPGSKALQSLQKLRIGSIYGNAVKEDVFLCNLFSGLIDELEIYGTALTQSQIAQKYKSLRDEAKLDVYRSLRLDSSVLADDRYAPQYHLRTAQNWQNETSVHSDPSGSGNVRLRFGSHSPKLLLAKG